MGACSTTVKKVTFDFTDEQITKVTVESDFEGDCPINVRRFYEKAFPARLSAVDILTMEEGGIHDYLLW